MTPFGESRHPTVTIQSKALPGKLADWRRVLATHYKHLGRTSRLHRFRTLMPNDALQSLANDANPDIVLGIKAQGRIIGVLEIFKGTDGHAEIGISVEDAHQGEGFGTALFLDGLLAAEKIGVRTADLYFGSANHGIRGLVQTVGGKIIQHGPDCEAHIDIPRYKPDAVSLTTTAQAKVAQGPVYTPCFAAWPIGDMTKKWTEYQPRSAVTLPQ
jgi:GNAT superfamily N-acetyltransferase